MHHVFQIPKAFLDMEQKGETLTCESLTASPPDSLRTSADIADFGEVVRDHFRNWWKGSKGQDFSNEVPTYFGGTSRHEMLERTVWHSTQHVRQVASLLDQAGVTPDEKKTHPKAHFDSSEAERLISRKTLGGAHFGAMYRKSRRLGSLASSSSRLRAINGALDW